MGSTVAPSRDRDQSVMPHLEIQSTAIHTLKRWHRYLCAYRIYPTDVLYLESKNNF